MKYRNQFRKYTLFANTGASEGAGGGGDNSAGMQTGGENNDENNLITTGSLWDTDSNDEGTAANYNDSGVQSSSQQSAEEIFNSHVESLDLAGGIDARQIAQDMQTGNIESFQGALASVAQNAYKAAIMDANKMMEAKVQQAVDKAVSQSDGNFKSDMATSKMNEALPFTANPAIAPVAKTLLAKFIAKGQDLPKAIKSVEQYYKHSAEQMGFVMPSKSPSRPGQQGFNNNGGSNNNTQQQNDDSDWINILSGGS